MLSLSSRRHIPLPSTFPSYSPLKSSLIFFNFLLQILYFPHKSLFHSFKLLKFAQFHLLHLSLSLSKTLTSIVKVKGCRESKASICSHFSSCQPPLVPQSFYSFQFTMGKKQMGESSQAPSLPKKTSTASSFSSARSRTRGTKNAYLLNFSPSIKV